MSYRFMDWSAGWGLIWGVFGDRCPKAFLSAAPTLDSSLWRAHCPPRRAILWQPQARLVVFYPGIFQMVSAQSAGMGGIVFIKDRNTPSRQRIAQSSTGIFG